MLEVQQDDAVMANSLYMDLVVTMALEEVRAGSPQEAARKEEAQNEEEEEELEGSCRTP